MNSKKFFYISLGLVAALLFLLGGSLYYMNDYLQKSSNSLVKAKLDSRVTEEREKYYIQARKDLAKYSDISTTLAKVLPKDKDQAIAVAEIGQIADETGINIKQISFPSSTLGEKKVSPAITTTTPVSSAAPTPATPTITQAKPVDGVTGVLSIEAQIQFVSTKTQKLTYPQLLSFLDKIERNRRTMQVSSISITPSSSDQIDASISIRIFVKP